MEYNNFFKWVENYYKVDINNKLRNTLAEHFGDDLNIYTDQDLYEQSQKNIQTYKEKYINQNNYKYYKHL